MLNRLLASIGIGSAKIDTVLDSGSYVQGQEVKGTVRMKGGNVEQNIDTIEIAVKTEYIKEHEEHKHHVQTTLVKYHVSSPFTLQPGEQREVPFSFTLPNDTPLTIGHTPVWINTELAISSAIDPSDNDRIEVKPSPQVAVVLKALDILGFRLRHVTCKHSHRGNRPFVQEFEFVPTALFRGHLDELEAIFRPRGEDLELLLQIDRKVRGLASLFAEALDMDESHVRVQLSKEQLSVGPEALANQLKEMIEQYI